MPDRPTTCCSATAARIWKRCSSTSRATGAPPGRRPLRDRAGQRNARDAVLLRPGRRHVPAALLRAEGLLAAPHRDGLLADHADDHLGFLLDLPLPEQLLAGRRVRRADRGGDAVGRAVPRPARLL